MYVSWLRITATVSLNATPLADRTLRSPQKKTLRASRFSISAALIHFFNYLFFYLL
jgi:NAD dependent epimerase/dehydratase family enzyme